MAKPKPLKLGKFDELSCYAYTVGKVKDTNIAQSYELIIEAGVVVKVNEVSRAPDRPITVISLIMDRLWSACRVQSAKTFNEAIDG